MSNELAGHKPANSCVRRMAVGASSRGCRAYPSLSKNCPAVVVSKDLSVTPRDRAQASALATSLVPQPCPRDLVVTARERSNATESNSSNPTIPCGAATGPHPRKCSRCKSPISDAGNPASARRRLTQDIDGLKNVFIAVRVTLGRRCRAGCLCSITKPDTPCRFAGPQHSCCMPSPRDWRVLSRSLGSMRQKHPEIPAPPRD